MGFECRDEIPIIYESIESRFQLRSNRLAGLIQIVGEALSAVHIRNDVFNIMASSKNSAATTPNGFNFRSDQIFQAKNLNLFSIKLNPLRVSKTFQIPLVRES